MLALWFPYLATDRILRARWGRSWRSGAQDESRAPLVIRHRDRNTQRVASFCEKGARLGLRPGTGIADLRAMQPGVEIVEADEAADRTLLVALADWCDRYTPLVALDGANGLFLDITGCAHLFGGEQAMIDDLVRRLFEQGLHARAGLAATPGMAWAAARFLKPVPLPAGEEAAALSPLPLSALRLDPPVRAGLESLGLRTVGAIMNAARAPLARRFGAALLLRLDQALGFAEEAVSPRLPVAPLSVERALPQPIVLTDDVERLVFLLAGALKSELERRGEGARVLQLALFRVDGAVRRIPVGASRPLRDPATILRLFRERLAGSGGLEADCGFELARLSVLETARMEEVQADLAGGNGNDDGDLALFADRVRARLGTDTVLAARLVESHVPERSVAFTPFPASRADEPGPVAPERPIRLLPRPEPVDVAMAEVPEGPPRQFRWRRTLHRVERAEGPERIAPEWWLSGAGKEEPIRDYFRVEDERGRRYWLYREGRYGVPAETPRWFLHGFFA